MVITCPNCHTQFNLDNKQYMPGRKARCSICAHIFILMAVIEEEPDVSFPAQPQVEAPAHEDSVQEVEETGPLSGKDSGKFKKGNAGKKDAGAPARGGRILKKLLLIFVLLIFLAGSTLAVLNFTGYLSFKDFKSLDGLFSSAEPAEDPVVARIADVDKVRDILLLDVKHSYVQNVKLGPLVVITGKVRNNFSTPKEKIRVEAALLDNEGKVLAVQQQFCGIVVPDIQLQILGQRELAQALDNRFEMLANNINIRPGGEVPFMVVFVYPPTSMAEYSVMVADVSDPPDMTAPAAK
jgi:predicted Zn finger-like uncharacterized protein